MTTITPKPIVKEFTLSNGSKIPSIALGTWQSPAGQVRDAVAGAIKAGYRHIDGAWGYGAEEEVGEGIKLSGVPREEIWITSKLFEFHHEPHLVRAACLDSIRKMDCGYLDLYLMHWPLAFVTEPPSKAGDIPTKPRMTSDGKKKVANAELSENVLPTWREMEKLVDEGLVKNIGVSNFNIRKTRKLLKEARIKPVVDQVELSLASPQPELISWLQKHSILPQAYSPLGSTGASQANLEVVERIAKAHNVQGANVLLSWSVMRGCNPLPKTVTVSRAENNLKLVQLTDEEFKELEEASMKQAPHRVCDQTESVEPRVDIFEENHPEHNDKVQATLDD